MAEPGHLSGHSTGQTGGSIAVTDPPTCIDADSGEDTQPDTHGDPVEVLIDAWIAWENAPSFRTTVVRKQTALAALLAPQDRSRAHEEIAAYRRHGYSVPDAIQSVINDHPQPDRAPPTPHPEPMRRLHCPHCGHTHHTRQHPASCPQCHQPITEAA